MSSTPCAYPIQPSKQACAEARLPSESSSQQTFSFTIRSSSPMIEEDRLSVKEFCEKYKLNTKAEKCLEALQFTPGDNLKHISDQEVKDAGIGNLGLQDR